MQKPITKSDAYSLFDYHERTGLYPKEMTEAQYHAIMTKFNIKPDREHDTDPAGGSGLYSHQ